LPAAKKISFTTTIIKPPNQIWYYCAWVSVKYAKSFVSNDNKRVVCTLNKTITYQAALMPMGDGDFFILINQTHRKQLKLNEGDEVYVELEKDESEYGLPMPDEFASLLEQDMEGSEYFHKLTAGKQRSMLFIIGKPKSADLRIRNGIAVLEHLKRNNGTINFRQLNTDIKNTY
jgi:hypothetical protein